MATKLITFLGNIPYINTDYIYQGTKICHSEYAGEAVFDIFEPEQVFVIVTKESYAMHFEQLQEKIKRKVVSTNLQDIHIPTPRSEEDIWEIFNIITSDELIQEGDKVIVDFTNAFRSIPILVLIISNYLRNIRNAELIGLMYAEFVREQKTTPIYNFIPFLRLLDWTTATENFTNYGRISNMSTLLQSYNSNKEDGVAKLIRHLEMLSLSLYTSRPTKVMELSSTLDSSITSAKQDIQGGSTPFGLLLDKIETEYSCLGLENTQDRANSKLVLHRLLKMIDWYVEKDLLIQAMTLAREWLVSLVVYHQGGDIFDDRRGRRNSPKGDRQLAEEVINSSTNSSSFVSNIDIIKSIWKKVDPDNQQAADIRNDLAHCGMRHNPREPADIVHAVKDICQELHKLLPS